MDHLGALSFLKLLKNVLNAFPPTFAESGNVLLPRCSGIKCSACMCILMYVLATTKQKSVQQTANYFFIYKHIIQF